MQCNFIEIQTLLHQVVQIKEHFFVFGPFFWPLIPRSHSQKSTRAFLSWYGDFTYNTNKPIQYKICGLLVFGCSLGQSIFLTNSLELTWTSSGAKILFSLTLTGATSSIAIVGMFDTILISGAALKYKLTCHYRWQRLYTNCEYII